MTKPTNDKSVLNDQKMIIGITKYFTKMPTLSPKGRPTTPAALLAVFQADLDRTAELQALEAQLADKRLEQRAARAQAVQTRADVKAYIVGNYGDQATAMLTDFGLTAPKKATVTPATKVAAITQAQATRKARGTKGKKQKAKIKGTVAASPAPAPATTPAAPAAK